MVQFNMKVHTKQKKFPSRYCLRHVKHISTGIIDGLIRHGSQSGKVISTMYLMFLKSNIIKHNAHKDNHRIRHHSYLPNQIREAGGVDDA